MKTGVIDIGTNTFHLLIAEQNGTIDVLHKEKVSVRIGKGGISDGIIAPEAIERALATLRSFKETIDKLNVKKVYTTATSAVRSAKNKLDFINIVKEKTDFDIEVLSGEEEAFLIHQGVMQAIVMDQTGLIVDIGGGSIEFIIADSKGVKWLKSYEIGGQRLIDQFHKSDPIEKSEIEALKLYLDDHLKEVYQNCKKFGAKVLIGSSGSFDTFWDIQVRKKALVETTSPEIDTDQFQEIYQELLAKNKAQRLAIPGMIPMRVDMIVGAAIVVQNIMNHCKFDLMKISSYALKEGVLFHGLPSRK